MSSEFGQVAIIPASLDPEKAPSFEQTNIQEMLTQTSLCLKEILGEEEYENMKGNDVVVVTPEGDSSDKKSWLQAIVFVDTKTAEQRKPCVGSIGRMYYNHPLVIKTNHETFGILITRSVDVYGYDVQKDTPESLKSNQLSCVQLNIGTDGKYNGVSGSGVVGSLFSEDVDLPSYRGHVKNGILIVPSKNRGALDEYCRKQHRSSLLWVTEVSETA